MLTICHMPSTIRNIPKHNDNMFSFVFVDSIEPTTAPMIAGGMIINPLLKLTNLFLLCIINAIIAIGMNVNRFRLCAKCCDSPPSSVNSGINRVPPPIPIPPKTPPIIPANE